MARFLLLPSGNGNQHTSQTVSCFWHTWWQRIFEMDVIHFLIPFQNITVARQNEKDPAERPAEAW